MEIVLRLFVRFCICEISKELCSGLLFYLRFGRGKVFLVAFACGTFKGSLIYDRYQFLGQETE